MSFCEFFRDLKTRWTVRQENVQLPNRATAARRGRGTLSCCSSREEASAGGMERHRKARKQFDCMWSGEVQVVTRDLEKDFCVVRLERAWAEREAPVRVNELSKEATVESWRR